MTARPLEELPPDNFGVHVENDTDRRRLLWLVNEIGVEKLLKSVAKHQARYPGSHPFVSLLLKWHNKRVPAAVYLPVRRPIPCVYLLVLSNHSGLKIGYAGGFAGRALQFIPTRYAVEAVFDLELSRAFEFAQVAEARNRATHCKALTAASQIKPPYVNRWGEYGVRWGAGGDGEWRGYESLKVLERELSALPQVLRVTTLSEALADLEKANAVRFVEAAPEPDTARQ